jgi:hypothetical protein
MMVQEVVPGSRKKPGSSAMLRTTVPVPPATLRLPSTVERSLAVGMAESPSSHIMMVRLAMVRAPEVKLPALLPGSKMPPAANDTAEGETLPLPPRRAPAADAVGPAAGVGAVDDERAGVDVDGAGKGIRGVGHGQSATANLGDRRGGRTGDHARERRERGVGHLQSLCPATDPAIAPPPTSI